jgi:hypothetical protein
MASKRLLTSSLNLGFINGGMTSLVRIYMNVTLRVKLWADPMANITNGDLTNRQQRSLFNEHYSKA